MGAFLTVAVLTLTLLLPVKIFAFSCLSSCSRASNAAETLALVAAASVSPPSHGCSAAFDADIRELMFRWRSYNKVGNKLYDREVGVRRWWRLIFAVDFPNA